MAVDQSIPEAKRAYCFGCSRPVWKSRTSAETQRCRDCRRAHTQAESHGCSGYRRGCRCSICRDAVAAKQREYTAHLKTEGRKRSRGGVERSCQHCGAGFLARPDNVRVGGGNHCSIRCANYTKAAARGFKRTPPRKSSFRRRAERLALKASLGSDGGNLVWVQGACLVCEVAFLSRGASSRYCSPYCRTKNRQRSFGLTWLDRMALFARDSWTCQICDEPVDYLADPLSDWYPSLDHIVPRSKGGTDEIANLRTAHRWCNSVRGDLSFYTDADLKA